MGIEIQRRALSFTEVSGQGMAEVNVQRSAALPGQYPALNQAEVQPILWAHGTAVVTSAEAGDGTVKVAGHIVSSIVYLPEGQGEAQVVELAEPVFEATVEVPNARPGDWAEAVATLSYLNAEPTGSKGLMLSGALAVSARTLRDHFVEVAESAVAVGPSKITVKTEDVTVERHVPLEPQDAVLEESLGHWQVGDEAQHRPCAASASVRVVGCDASDGKVVVSCEVAVEVACVQGSGRIVDILRRERLPLSITVVAPEAGRGMSARADAWVERASASVDSDGNVHVKVHVVTRPTLVAHERVNVVTAIQSETAEIVDVDTVWIVGERVVAEGSMQIDIADSVPVHAIAGAGAITGMEEIRSSHGYVGVTDVEAGEGEASLRGILAVRVIAEDIFEDQDAEYTYAKAMDIPVEFSDTVEIPDITSADRLEVRSVSHALAAGRVGASKMEVEGTVRFDLVAYRPIRVAVVKSAYTITPVQLDPYALTFCVVGPTDTLARIARKYGVTADALAAANSLSPTDALIPGEKIYIPAAR